MVMEPSFVLFTDGWRSIEESPRRVLLSSRTKIKGRISGTFLPSISLHLSFVSWLLLNSSYLIVCNQLLRVPWDRRFLYVFIHERTWRVKNSTVIHNAREMFQFLSDHSMQLWPFWYVRYDTEWVFALISSHWGNIDIYGRTLVENTFGFSFDSKQFLT